MTRFNLELPVDELTGHKSGVISIVFTDTLIFTGTLAGTIRTWSLKEMNMRIDERRQMLIEDLYSAKMMIYKGLTDKKKRKRKGRKGKRGKSKKKK